MDISTNGSDFSLLLEHELPPRWRVMSSETILCEECFFGNTEEVGTTRPNRGDGETALVAKREAEAGLPGGSRDLLSLQGGHAGNDTSAHIH